MHLKTLFFVNVTCAFARANEGGVEDVLATLTQEVINKSLQNLIAKFELCYMGMKSGLIPNSAVTASTFWGSAHESYRARLDNKISEGSRGQWSSKKNEVGQWIEVDFGTVKDVAGVITQGRPQRYGQWVRKYKVSCGTDRKTLQFVKEGASDKKMHLEFFMLVIVTCACTRAEECAVDDAVGKKCQIMNDQSSQSLIETFELCFMGVKSGLIPDSAVTGSTFWGPHHETYRARLDNRISEASTGAWSAKNNKVGEWIQVDFGTVRDVAGVITQGRPQGYSQWVRQYKVACGIYKNSLQTIKAGGSDKIYTGNSDTDTKVYNRFPSVLSCRYIRIYPQSWNNHMSMRLEFVRGNCFDKHPL